MGDKPLTAPLWTQAETNRLIELANAGTTSAAALEGINAEFHGGNPVRTLPAMQKKVQNLRNDCVKIKAFKRPAVGSKYDLDKIVEMAKSGKSHSAIASAIGTTKSAINGLVFRLRAQGHDVPITPNIERTQRMKAEKIKRGSLKPQLPPRNFGKSENPDKAVSIRMPDLSDLPISKGETLIQMNGNGCKSISGRNGRGEAVYCGAYVEGRGSYCAHHRAAYTVPIQNKDKNVFRQYRRYL